MVMWVPRVEENLRVSLLLLATLATALSARAAEPPSWPRFHGAKGDNISPDTGLLQRWPDGGPKLAWTAKGLGPKTGGKITWRWRVGASTHPGRWPVIVRCGKSGTLRLRLRVLPR